ncbi:GIY-YIG nuclease family protein [Vibrio parahaemolyticus]|uniref:GIY-YIG nuclease family protein n=2 Tax=Vibrio parahaemolyticus TaxID=670 RepID=UPI000A391846|nr:GIY-YIG nuclease family protein [Vibrio parahaemolyticus]OUD23316.1 hypothetical protein BUN10_15660 [Vibrio parahaemolyticus]TOD71715.1 hypothetical protein CGJ59_03350 [Vibrio parahaemolyticus]
MDGCVVYKGRYYSPHVYIIVSRDVIYIGETQRLPIRRWSDHLSKSGSFYKKLDKYLNGGGCVESYMSSLNFFGYCCHSAFSDINFNYCGYLVPTQALEHKLHELIIETKPFGSEKTVISETKKTMPRYFEHWDYVNEIAQKVLSVAIKELAL